MLTFRRRKGFDSISLVQPIGGLPDDLEGELVTTTRRWVGLGLMLFLGGCGGSDAPRDNAAASATFAYGSPQAATSGQAGVMGATVASIDAFQAAPGTGTGLGAADAAGVTGALLEGGPIDSFSPAAVGATSAAAFDVPACATITSGKVNFAGCRVTVSQSSGGTSTSGSVTVDGDVSLSADGQTLTWDLTYGVALTMNGASPLAMSGTMHSAGRVVATPTTAAGSITSEIALTVLAGGQAVSAAADESLAFDVTRSDGCASGVTGGTLEARRVWASRPAGATPAQLPDAAVRVDWTGCGAATVRLGSR
jgi:hypothetical protein